MGLGPSGVSLACRPNVVSSDKKTVSIVFRAESTGDPRGIRRTRTPPARRVDAAPTLNLMRSIDDQGARGGSELVGAHDV
jgi:hypothetical protein